MVSWLGPIVEVASAKPEVRKDFRTDGSAGDIRCLAVGTGDCPKFWGLCAIGAFFRSVFDLGDRVPWMLRLVKIGAEGDGRSVDVMEIHRPDLLGYIADLGERGLALDEMKRLLAALQQEIVAAQVRDHAVRRPTCSPLWQRLPGKGLPGPRGGYAIRPGHDTASPLSLCRVSRERVWHRLAVALLVDAGTGSATAAPLSAHDLSNRGRSFGADVSG
jgi:hypothetical protein